MKTARARRRIIARLLLGACWLPRSVLAESTDEAANRHFKQALGHLQQFAVEAAIAEFEQAYQLSPHFGVLYNLGQAYGVAGRVVEATDTLKRYLEEGGPAIDAKRRAQVESSLRIYEGLIGSLVVTTGTSNATISVDGRAVAAGREIRLAAGSHAVVAALEGHLPSSEIVTIRATETSRIHLELEPRSPPPPAWVTIRCPVPQVQATIDGQAAGELADISPLRLTGGTHRIALSRLGYASRELELETAPGSFQAIECLLEPVFPPLAGTGVPLQIVASEPGSRIWVDDEPFHGGLVPVGPHRLVVEHANFETWRGDIDAKGSAPNRIVVRLRPTPDFLRKYEAEARTRRSWAIASGGAGLALGLVAGGLFALESRAMASWRADRAALSLETASQPSTPEQQRRAGGLDQRAADIQGLGDAATAATVAAAALVAASVTLLLTGDDPNRYAPDRNRARLGTGEFAF
jgi:hypothetical protein